MGKTKPSPYHHSTLFAVHPKSTQREYVKQKKRNQQPYRDPSPNRGRLAINLGNRELRCDVVVVIKVVVGGVDVLSPAISIAASTFTTKPCFLAHYSTTVWAPHVVVIGLVLIGNHVRRISEHLAGEHPKDAGPFGTGPGANRVAAPLPGF